MPPAVFLFLFAPLTVEYVSGSSPYLNPFVCWEIFCFMVRGRS